MSNTYSFIGPDDVFMDARGRLYKKAAEETFIPMQNKYTDAEDRYIEKIMNQEGRESQ